MPGASRHRPRSAPAKLVDTSPAVDSAKASSVNIGLYYPFINFRSEAWLKLSALYWDKMVRIVPYDHVLVDSDTVRRLVDELGFVENYNPEPEDMLAVASDFFELLNRYGKALADNYSVRNFLSQEPAPKGVAIDSGETIWTGGPSQAGEPFLTRAVWTGGPSQAGGLAYLYIHKLSPQLHDAFVESGLGVGAGAQIGVHPRLGFFYMQALASHIAKRNSLFPVTDSTVDHAVSSFGTPGLAQALLTPAQRGIGRTLANDEEEVVWTRRDDINNDAAEALGFTLLTLAVEAVIPRDLNAVPVEKIVKLRKRHDQEFVAFQHYLQEIGKNAEELGATSSFGFRTHVDVLYRRHLAGALEDLKQAARAERIETVVGSLQVRVAVPTLLGSAATALGYDLRPGQMFIGAGAVVLSVIPYLVKRTRQTREAIRRSPLAYLMLAEQELRPSRLTTLVNRDFRRLFSAT